MRTKIRRRENKNGTSYQAIVFWGENGKEKQKSKTFKTQKEAKTYLEQIIKNYNNPTSIAKGDALFTSVITSVNKIHSNKIKESTMERYSSLSKKIEKYFEGQKIKEITPKKIEEFYNYILKKPSSRSNANPYNCVKKMHNYLHLVFVYAQKWGYVVQNPVDMVTPPKKERKEVQCWNEKETNIFLNSVKNEPVFYNPVFFALNTGVRIGELCGLRWCDINFKDNIAKIRLQLNRKKELTNLKTKAAKRDIYLSPSIVKMLKNIYNVEQPNINDYVFKTAKKEPFNPISLSKSFTRRVKKCNDVTQITFHGLRHTYVTLCVLKFNIPLHYVSKIIGHSRVSITSDIYFHLDNNTALNPFKQVENLFEIKEVC